VQEAWTEGFYHHVGYDYGTGWSYNCFGRCGIGCANHDADDEVYTQRCFNHDGCVDEHGYTALNCMHMFGCCISDYLFGTSCGLY